MASGGTVYRANVRAMTLIALLSVVTVLVAGCSTTSGPSEAGDETPPGMVRVPAGSFIMGDGVSTCGVDERDVTLTRDFYLGQYEVTNQEYLDAVQWAYDNGYVTATTSSVQDNLDRSTVELLNLDDPDSEIAFSDGVFSFRNAGHGINPDHPVKEVTWYGAARYCDWLSLQEDPPLDRAYAHSGDWLCNGGNPYAAEGYRLPTDTEWEYAAQYDDERKYPWGNEATNCSLANDSGCAEWTFPVGSCPAGNSALGLSDMKGNVLEWCNEWWLCDHGTAPVTDPVEPLTGSVRVIRGGSFLDWGPSCASRFFYDPGNCGAWCGLRAARTAHP